MSAPAPGSYYARRPLGRPRTPGALASMALYAANMRALWVGARCASCGRDVHDAGSMSYFAHLAEFVCQECE